MSDKGGNQENWLEHRSHGNFELVGFSKPATLDIYTCRELVDIFKEGNAKGIQDWIIDLTNIKFIDSSGLSALTNQALHLNSFTKKLKLLNPNKGTKHLFMIGGFAAMFDIISDLSTLR